MLQEENMKLSKIIVLLFLALAFVFPAAGCNKPNPNTETDIEISFWRAGYGEEYFKKIIAAFEEEHPEYNIVYEPAVDNSTISNTLNQGANYNSIDIYFSVSAPASMLEYVEPLDDILEETVEGESMPIGEKFDEEMLNSLRNADGHYYSLPYSGGWSGIVYNADIVNGTDFTVPNTTDELEILAMDLYGEGYTPFIHFNSTEGGYWDYVYNVWQAQYDGLDYYTDRFLMLSDGENSPVKDVLLKEDGRKEVLDFMAKIITPEYVESSSNVEVFTSQQVKFLEGKAVMMVNGSWLQNEMSNTDSRYTNFKMMKTPVISSIRKQCTTIQDDSELSSLIDAIDAAGSDITAVPLKAADGSYDVNETDLKRVYEARNLMSSNIDGHGAVIPNYAVAKEGAKEFLKFYYSDRALEIYTETLHSSLPISFSDGRTLDTTGWSEWELQQLNLFDTAIPLLNNSLQKSDVFTYGGASAYAGINFVSRFCARGTDHMTNTAVWEQIQLTVNQNWDIYLQNAGLK